MFSFRKWIAARITPGSNSGEQNDSHRRSDSTVIGSSSSLPSSGSPFYLRLPDDSDSIVASSASNNAAMSGRGDISGRSVTFTRSPDFTVLHFYKADAELNEITAELDSFEGKNEPLRCAHLVNLLRSAQDKVICLLFQMMDECECDRTSRDYRLKFPDDLVVGGENGESLNGQIWFGAECLGSGSNIMNHESESETLRPLAKKLTQSMQQIRSEIRYQLLHTDPTRHPPSTIIKRMSPQLEAFDQLFTYFEYEYVRAMLPIKTADEIERLHELTVLFSEAVARSLKRGLISQEDIDECHPHVLIAIPRLAIIYGLIHCQESPILRNAKDNKQSHIFRPYYSLLFRARELILALRPIEVQVLERMLTNEESVSLFQDDTDALQTFTGNNSAGKSSVDNNKNSNNFTALREDNSSQISRVCVVVDSVDDDKRTQVDNDTVKQHYNLSIAATRSTGSTPSTSVGSCKTDDSNSYPLSSSTSTSTGTSTSATGGTSRRLSPSFRRRRRHSDPIQFLTANVARKLAYSEAYMHAKSIGRSPSTLSLTTTVKEKQNRLSKMSFCTVDVKMYQGGGGVGSGGASSTSTSCPVTSSRSESKRIRHTPRQINLPSSQSFAPDSPLTSQISSFTYKRGSTLPSASRTSRRYTLATDTKSNNNTLYPTGKTISSLSLDSNTSTDSVDSFELALAVAAKSGYWISPGTRHLLHRLFVKISGVADQLQSNHATDLRTILRAVFKMHSTVDADENENCNSSSTSSSSTDDVKVSVDSSDSSDDVSVEEALEAREESAAVASGISNSSSSSSSSYSIVNKYPTASDLTNESSSHDNRVSDGTPNVTNIFPRVPRVTHTCCTLPDTTSTGPRHVNLSSNDAPHHQAIPASSSSSSSSSAAATASTSELMPPFTASHHTSSPTAAAAAQRPISYVRRQAPVMDTSQVSLIPPHHPSHHHQRQRLLLQQHHHPIVHSPDTIIFASPPRRRTFSEGGDDGNSILYHHTFPIQNTLMSHGDHVTHVLNGSLAALDSPPYTAPVWIPDEWVDSCASCTLSFNIIRRRHHCRHCGLIYCNNCSSHFVPLSQFGYTKPVRVCDDCLIFLAHNYPTTEQMDHFIDTTLAIAHTSSQQQHVPSPSSSPPPLPHHHHHHPSLPSTVAFTPSPPHPIV